MTTTRRPRELANLSPLGQLRAGRLPLRLPLLLFGLYLYGASMAMIITADLGPMPWDVLHTGLAGHLPLSFGTIVVVISLVILPLWIPLRQMAGLGTIANALLIGPSADFMLWLLPTPASLPVRIGLLVGGVLLNGVATAMYIGSQFGPGPRDGLMTGLARRTGRSIRLVRTLIEVAVVIVGWLLGGLIGAGTVLYALAIGPVTQAVLPVFTVELRSDRKPDPAPANDDSHCGAA